MDIRTPRSPPRRPGRHGTTGDRILQGKVRWQHEKDRNRLPGSLVQIGDVLATPETNPDSPSNPGTRVLERSTSVLGGYHPSRIHTRTIRDRLQIGTKTALTKPEWMSRSRIARGGPPGRRGPPNHRILYKDIRWRAQKCDYHVAAPLVQIGGAPAAQAAHPDSRRTLGSRTDQSRHMGFWEGGGKQRLRSGSWPLRTPSASMALG